MHSTKMFFIQRVQTFYLVFNFFKVFASMTVQILEARSDFV